MTPPDSMGDKEQADQRFGRFSLRLRAGTIPPTLRPRFEKDALLFLLPDDPEFPEQEILAAAGCGRRGQNVHLHHVRVADLCDVRSRRPIGTEPGTRRPTDESETGGVLTNQILGILGEDGTCRDTDEPLPIPCDDEDDRFFRF
ncbi:MAG: hypothetical protein AVDCRST_MAG19-1327 [uncultured Thermomicrobiales bacterium]|uniref:Uncharacterized protein n=1 Tax=uncultured Thermomicrobiales bacterium TaxID=1645740 RepID=A0A6J4UT18_9BACT|nr:MAG: hypothetical protein AVDCRST_MAG19-1327 [uncultured Thermomicrobiales bacterium]